MAIANEATKHQLLVSAGTPITCPKCEYEFDLGEGFAKNALESIESASNDALAAVREEERAASEKRAQQLAGEREKSAKHEAEALRQLLREQGENHAKALAETRELAARAIAPQVQSLKEQLAVSESKSAVLDQRSTELDAREKGLQAAVEIAARAKAVELIAAEKQGLEAELQASREQVAALRTQEIALRKERGDLTDKAASLEVENARKLDAERELIAVKARTQEQERTGLEKAELQKKLDDLSAQLAHAQRKIEQGSQQLQGEVLELAIEESLRRAFPYDTIEEVKKGQRGGDVLQHVTTKTGQAAGTILWETKRAKDWSAQWIPKLKEDMRGSGAAVAILVTIPGACPKEWPASAYFALHEEVWVTQPSCVLGVAELLRAGLIDCHRQRAISAGKGEKMEAVYDYLTSPQFAQKLKAVFETFLKMKAELDSEKNITMQRWARREKMLEQGRVQLLGIGGEIQGLAQQELPMLELESEELDLR